MNVCLFVCVNELCSLRIRSHVFDMELKGEEK